MLTKKQMTLPADLKKKIMETKKKKKPGMKVQESNSKFMV